MRNTHTSHWRPCTISFSHRWPCPVLTLSSTCLGNFFESNRLSLSSTWRVSFSLNSIQNCENPVRGNDSSAFTDELEYGNGKSRLISFESPRYRRFDRDMLARFIVRLIRAISWCIVHTEDFLVCLFEKINMHKKRKFLLEKGSWHQIDDVGPSSTPFDWRLLFESNDRIKTK